MLNNCTCGGSCDKCKKHGRFFDSSPDYLISEKIGRKQAFTPEGFLLCESVRLARVGEQLYEDEELPEIEALGGIIRVDRDAKDVFNPISIASFEGKPVTIDHPDDDVTPETWGEVAVGHVQNIRSGDEEDDGYLVGDLLICRREGIEAAQGQNYEISNGYDADYEELSPGRGRQYNIIGNHVALVKRGRCGPSCSIRDHRGVVMPKLTLRDRIKKAFKARDEESFNKAMDDMPMDMTDDEDPDSSGSHVEVHNHLHMPGETDDAEPAGAAEADAPPAWATGLIAKVEELSAKVDAMGVEPDDDDLTEDEDPAEPDEKVEGKKTGDRRRNSTRDAMIFKPVFDATASDAEIIAPGLKMPVFDPKATREKMRDCLCTFRRRALMKAYDTNGDLQEVIDDLLGGKEIETHLPKMTHDSVGHVFKGAVAAAKQANKVRISMDGKTNDAKPLTLREINNRNREAYGQPKL